VRPEVIVVGAGAIGSSVAYYLAKAGVRVMLFDRGEAGHEATRASAGMLIPLSESTGPGPFTDLAIESARLFQALNDELLERTGIDIGYRRTPLLRVALDEMEEHELRERRGWQDRSGIPVAWLDASSALDLEPGLNPQLRAALYYANDHQVNALDLTRALVRATVDLGATLRERTPVEGLILEGDRVTGIETGGETVHAAEVVIATGAWSAAWGASLRTSLPVRPVRGQMVAVQTSGTPIRNVVFSNAGYMVSKPEGLTYVGATEEEAGFDSRPTAGGVAWLLGVIPRLVPGLSAAKFAGAWAGLRPGTPDRLPLLGRLPGWQGVTLATGHFRNGVLLAPATGQLISDLVRLQRSRLPLQAFDPARFTIRAA
jgi:glycine oxidase